MHSVEMPLVLHVLMLKCPVSKCSIRGAHCNCDLFFGHAQKVGRNGQANPRSAETFFYAKSQECIPPKN